jgi:hypothetical protein
VWPTDSGGVGMPQAEHTSAVLHTQSAAVLLRLTQGARKLTPSSHHRVRAVRRVSRRRPAAVSRQSRNDKHMGAKCVPGIVVPADQGSRGWQTLRAAGR